MMIEEVAIYDWEDFLKFSKASMAELMGCEPEDVKLVAVQLHLTDSENTAYQTVSLTSEDYEPEHFKDE